VHDREHVVVRERDLHGRRKPDSGIPVNGPVALATGVILWLRSIHSHPRAVRSQEPHRTQPES